MKKSIVNLLKKRYSDMYFIDYSSRVCEVITSSIVKTDDERIILDTFISMITDEVEQENKEEVKAFFDSSKLRAEFIKGNDYDVYFIAQNELYHAVMHPETGESGLIYVRNVRGELGDKLGFETVNKAAGIMRITRQAVMNIIYADSSFCMYTGFDRDEIKDRFKNTAGRIIKDDLYSLLEDYDKNGPVFTLRLKTKDGSTKWTDCYVVRNNQFYDLIFIDAGDRLHKEIQQKAYDQVRNLLIENNNNQFFIYNIDNNMLSVTDLREQRQFVIKDFLQNIESWSRIHEDDRRVLGLAFSALMRGSKESDELTCKTDFAGEGYIDSRIILKTVTDPEGQIYKIIGTVN